jgi:TnpA family transposase
MRHDGRRQAENPLIPLSSFARPPLYAQLAWTHNWYLSPENYQNALGMIISSHHELPFARHWGSGTSSSSDGQFFRSGRSGGGAAEVNAKYGNEPGVKIYSHLSDHFASFGSRIMSAMAGEAPYVLDGLVLGAGQLPLHEHYTDTGGATDHVFALCHLLGFRFAPRLRDIADRKLGSIAASSTYTPTGRGASLIVRWKIRNIALPG